MISNVSLQLNMERITSVIPCRPFVDYRRIIVHLLVPVITLLSMLAAAIVVAVSWWQSMPTVVYHPITGDCMHVEVSKDSQELSCEDIYTRNIRAHRRVAR